MMIEQLKLESDEHIVLQVRRHWFIIITQLLSLTVVALIPILAYIFLEKMVTSVLDHDGAYALLLFLYVVWLLFIWMAMFHVWTNYYLDVWTLTNKRFVAIDQRGMFHRTSASFRLERLQDVTTSVDGIIATLLDYGTLEMQTAGEERNFRERGLPSPSTLKAAILEASDALTHDKS
jgi:membrane protein YdbS with pleckstrin-like domain